MITPTPGPWRVRGQQHDDWGMIRGADGFPVASTCMLARYTEEEATAARGAGTSPPTVEANAYLVAAAPELLSALRFILAFYDPGQKVLDTEAWKRAEAAGRAAVTKAEGRAP